MKENINSSPFESFEEKEIKMVWKKSYTWLLAVNAAYIIVFYLIMKFL